MKIATTKIIIKLINQAEQNKTIIIILKIITIITIASYPCDVGLIIHFFLNPKNKRSKQKTDKKCIVLIQFPKCFLQSKYLNL